MKHKQHKFGILLILLLLVSACSEAADNTPSQSTEIELEVEYPVDATDSPESSDSAYPYPESTTDYSVDSAYPSGGNAPEDITYPLTIEVPEPQGETGVITGKILTLSTKEPYLAPGLYLGEYIEPNEEMENAPMLVGISPGVDPKAVQAQDGVFVFSDIEPGEYALFLWSPINIMPITDAATNEEISVTVEAGKITDLGIIYVP
jgi:hypothetical protein